MHGRARAGCACTNISIMQLFHELKQQFPTVPDHVVSSTIESHCHDRSACRSRLQRHADEFVTHAFPRRPSRPSTPPPSPSCPNVSPTPAPAQPRPDSLHLSLNLDCRLGASVNLTVCTPTAQNDLTIALASQTDPLDSVLCKQRKRLETLEFALRVDRARLVTMQKEVRMLQEPAPSSPVVARLRWSVRQLHVRCQRLTERLDESGSIRGEEREASSAPRPPPSGDSFSERQPRSWRCHVCTFENSPVANKCDMCLMPRIILVRTTNNEVTVQLHPGISELRF